MSFPWLVPLSECQLTTESYGFICLIKGSVNMSKKRILRGFFFFLFKTQRGNVYKSVLILRKWSVLLMLFIGHVNKCLFLTCSGTCLFLGLSTRSALTFPAFSVTPVSVTLTLVDISWTLRAWTTLYFVFTGWTLPHWAQILGSHGNSYWLLRGNVISPI